MKINVEGFAAIAGTVLLGLASPAHSQITTIDFTGGYTTTWGNSSGNFGAGIYSALIDGSSSSGIICDDFNDEIVSNEVWNATTIQASALDASNIGDTTFGSSVGLNGYAQVAYLANDMFNGVTTYDNNISISQADISAAIWDITYAGTHSGASLQGLDQAEVNLVSWVTANVGASSLSADTDLYVLTPSPKTGYNPSGVGEPQEMWTSVPDGAVSQLTSRVPEGGAPLIYLLLAGVTCFGAMRFSSRGRLGKIETV